MQRFTCCSQVVVLVLQIKKAVKHPSCPQFRMTNLYFSARKKKRGGGGEPWVCRTLLYSPQKPSCTWLTRYQSTGFAAATRQTPDGYSRRLLPCWSKEEPLSCCWRDYMLFTKSLFTQSGPRSEGHSRTAGFYQTPSCYNTSR